MLRTQVAACARTPRLGFREDLCLELLDPGGLVEPGVRVEAGLPACPREERLRIPLPFHRDLRQGGAGARAPGSEAPPRQPPGEVPVPIGVAHPAGYAGISP